jgi:hypothetical protein
MLTVKIFTCALESCEIGILGSFLFSNVFFVKKKCAAATTDLLSHGMLGVYRKYFGLSALFYCIIICYKYNNNNKLLNVSRICSS